MEVTDTIFGDPVPATISVELGEYWNVPSGEAIAADGIPWIRSPGQDAVVVITPKRIPDELKVSENEIWATIGR